MFKIQIPTCAEALMKMLHDRGYDSYAVGGCVRDSLLGKTPHDWDFATSATPDDMLHVCAIHGIKVIETGIKHGTLTLCMFDEQYEFTTFRVDGNYSDGRHPDTVKFSKSITADLSRRDFTINAIAYNPEYGLIDPYDGCGDLQKGIIKCVGDPYERFTEDALRILRALRFASTYGFTIEENTSFTLQCLAPSLKIISAERIQSELCKLIMGKGALDILLKYFIVIGTIIPEFIPCIGFDQHNKYHQYDVYEHIMHALCNYTGDDMSIKIALLLHDIGKPSVYIEDERGGHFYGHSLPSAKIAKKVMKRLRFSNQIREEAWELITYHDAVLEPTPKVVRRMLNKIGEKRFRQLLEVRMADILAHTPDTQQSRIERCEQLKILLDQIIQEQQCFQMKDLAINGNDIKAFGVKEGKLVGDILKALLGRVIDGTLCNEKNILINEARSYIENESNIKER